MFMPFFSRILYTVVGITMPVGSFWADYNDTHIFNPKLAAAREVPRRADFVDVYPARRADDLVRMEENERPDELGHCSQWLRCRLLDFAGRRNPISGHRVL